MSEFDKIIGYDAIKEELMQLCDMIHNTDIYRKLGAKMSRGLLLHGEPGVGKSLMAMSFIKESGRNSYIIRRNKHDGDFINEIKGVFSKAAQNAPSIILLDDMDKFVVEDKSKEEYVAVQACIDEVSSLDVYVIATANSIRDIPRSLLRAGRFDRKIRVYPPRGNDAEKIIRHYLESKSIISDVNFDDIAKMLIGRSCAELETIINEAAIYAGYERKEKITMEHLVRSVLRIEYGVSNSVLTADALRLEKIAYHEAGHVVVSEVLDPDGVGLASLHARDKAEQSGFVIRCSDWLVPMHNILMLLAGKASTELKYGKVDEFASKDVMRGIEEITIGVVTNGICGISALNVFDDYENPSDMLRAKQECIIQAELERYMLKAKEIIAHNHEFVEAVATALIEKNILLNSDIRMIRNRFNIVKAAI